MRALALLLIAPTCRGGLEQQRAAQQRGGVGARRPPPAVGAIRWDAYFSQPGEAVFDDPNAGIVTRTTTFDMSPKEWHYRVPFFGAELNDSAIIANGNSAAVMAQELEYAAQSGINFWAFCNYPIGCKDYHPPPESCAGIQCCADNVALSCEHHQPLFPGHPVRASADRLWPSDAWNLYQSHPDQHKVNFTLLLQPGGVPLEVRGWLAGVTVDLSH